VEIQSGDFSKWITKIRRARREMGESNDYKNALANAALATA
jgi:hypothetical protein